MPASNPDILDLGNGKFALLHIGMGSGSPNGGKCNYIVATEIRCLSFQGDICSNHIPEQFSEIGEREGSRIHISNSLYGPWIPLEQNTLQCYNNPSVFKNGNGTIFYLCFKSIGVFEMKSAMDIRGPWYDVKTINVSELVSKHF